MPYATSQNHLTLMVAGGSADPAAFLGRAMLNAGVASVCKCGQFETVMRAVERPYTECVDRNRHIGPWRLRLDGDCCSFVRRPTPFLVASSVSRAARSAESIRRCIFRDRHEPAPHHSLCVEARPTAVFRDRVTLAARVGPVCQRISRFKASAQSTPTRHSGATLAPWMTAPWVTHPSG